MKQLGFKISVSFVFVQHSSRDKFVGNEKKNSLKVPASSCGFFGWQWRESHRPYWMVLAHITKKQPLPPCPHRHMDDRAAPYHFDFRWRWPGHAFWGEKKLPLSLFRGESFLWLPPFRLPSVKSKCQPAWERERDGEEGRAGGSAVCREEAIENIHDKILPPIQPDELLKSKMTFRNNTPYSSGV